MPFFYTHSTWYLFHLASLFFLFLAWGRAVLWGRSWWSAALFSLGLLLVGSLDTAYRLADHYTGAGINEVVIFQLQFGTDGMSGDLMRPIWIIVGTGLLPVLLGLLVLWLVVWRRRKILEKKAPPTTSVGPEKVLSPSYGRATILLLLVALGLNPGLLQSIQLLAPMNDAVAIKQLLNKAVAPPPAVLPAQPKSLVHVYVESFERTFSNQKIFPGLLPRVDALTKKGVDFSGIEQVPFTGWTIAGQTASNCGYPGIEGVTSMSRDHASHPCFTDLLHQAGYTQVFMMAVPLKFAGEGIYVMDHGFTSAYGGHDIAVMANQPNAPVSPWGVHDDTLFAAGLNEFHKLVKAGQPFNLEILTIDTHPMHGYPSPACTKKYPLASDGHEILNSVHCEDDDLGQFLETVRSQMPPNVVLAVQNDHLMADPPDIKKLLWPTPPYNVTREDRLTVWGADLAPRVVARHGSMFDVAPTMYSLLGFVQTPIGFGRDLLGKEPTLVEKYGMDWMYLHLQSILALPEFHSATKDYVNNASKFGKKPPAPKIPPRSPIQ